MQSSNVFALKQCVKSYQPTIKADRFEDLSWGDKQKKLLEDFGSRMKRKQLKSKEAGEVDIATISAKAGKNLNLYLHRKICMCICLYILWVIYCIHVWMYVV